MAGKQTKEQSSEDVTGVTDGWCEGVAVEVDRGVMDVTDVVCHTTLVQTVSCPPVMEASAVEDSSGGGTGPTPPPH